MLQKATETASESSNKLVVIYCFLAVLFQALMLQQGFQHTFEGSYVEQNYFLPSNTDYENCVVNPGYHNATAPVQVLHFGN